LENLKATNGSALYVYLSTDRNASDFVNIGRLKGNMDNKNNLIPVGTGLTKYDTDLKSVVHFRFRFRFRFSLTVPNFELELKIK
jgi:hypothetical protein